MSSLKAKLASTASGMSFEEWKNRPVYKAQCFTASIAHMLCGIHTRPGEGRVSAYGDPGKEGLNLFHCLPPYRNEAAKSLRNRVAHHIKQMRGEASSHRRAHHSA